MAKSLRRKLRQINLAKAYSAEESARFILDERTRELASRGSAAIAPAIAATPVLVCGAGRERYGIALDQVAEVLPMQTCVPIPDGPPALVGILGRGGHLVSVIDLAVALGSPTSSGDTVFEHLVLLRRERPRIALRVERAHGVTPASLIATEKGQTFRHEAVIGYAQAQSDFADQEPLLSLLDVERLVRPFLPVSPVAGV